MPFSMGILTIIFQDLCACLSQDIVPIFSWQNWIVQIWLFQVDPLADLEM